MEVKTLDWYAAYTLPKFEKKIYRELKNRDIETYLPLHTVFRKWSDRVKKVELPLFPNYIFVKPHDPLIHPSIFAKGILRFVAFEGRPAPISEVDIEKLRKLECIDLEVEPNLVDGARVRIIRGPLAGFEGRLFLKKGKRRFGVHIESIKQSLSLEVPGAYLEHV